MDIKLNGSQPSAQGPAEYFTGTVRVDPLFNAPAPARARGASVTFEPRARSNWHTHPLGQTLTRANAVWRVALDEATGVSKVGLFVQLHCPGPDGLALDEEGSVVVTHPGLGCVWLRQGDVLALMMSRVVLRMSLGRNLIDQPGDNDGGCRAVWRTHG